MIYFTGCTHFGHKNIIRLANRPFDSVEEMNETLRDNWNRTVKDNDTVYHLGDISWEDDPLEDTVWLKGSHVYIRGNHDQNFPFKMHDYIELKEGGNRFILFHYPIEEWNGWYKGSFHLHCHTHQHEKWTGERRYNVTVEANDYRPVSLDEIIESAKEEGFI